jgi:hypothetical protein
MELLVRIGLSQRMTMNLVVDCLLLPVVVFLDAVGGVLGPAKTPQKVVYQKIARLALLASVVVLVMAFPLSLIANPVIGIKPPLALGVVLLLVFLVAGNLCDDEAEDKP